jgi:hypothetical protein
MSSTNHMPNLDCNLNRVPFSSLAADMLGSTSFYYHQDILELQMDPLLPLHHKTLLSLVLTSHIGLSRRKYIILFFFPMQHQILVIDSDGSDLDH